jgi:hypothetical protein
LKYGVLACAAATVLAFCAVSQGSDFFPLLWPSVSFSLVGASYLGAGPHVFGKRPDGTIVPLLQAFLLPYLVCVWTIWRVLRLVKREPAYNELLPDVIIGRRLLPNEFPPGIEMVIDLTSEFPEPCRIRLSTKYESFPILDGLPANATELTNRVLQFAATNVRMYIHCAEGPGPRSNRDGCRIATAGTQSRSHRR